MKKKKFVLFLLLVCLCFYGFSTEVEDVFFKTGNDLFSLGLSQNYDDQKSFNLECEIKNDKDDFNIILDSYTKRYTNRLDILTLSDTRSYYYDDFCIKPSFGLCFAGDIKTQSAQNALHEVMDIPTLVLKYDFSFKTFFFTDLYASYTKKINEKINLSFIGDLENAFNLYNSQTFKAHLDYSDILGFGLGYRFYKANSISPTLVDFEKYNSGIISDFYVDSSFIKFNHYNLFANNFGFGTISVDFHALFEEKLYKEEDISFSLGKVFINLGKNMPSFKSLDVSYKINDKLSVYVDDTYEDGSTMMVPDDYDLSKRKTDRYSRIYTILTCGLSYKFDYFTYLKPKMNLGLGFFYSSICKLDYSQKDYAVKKDEKKAISPVLDLHVSVNALKDNFIIVSKSCLNVELDLGSYFVFNNDDITSVISSDGSLCTCERFVPYFGIRCNIAIDDI